MTTKDALAAEVGNVPGLDPNSYLVALSRVQLTGAETYVPLMDPTVARAAIDVLSTALSSVSIAEGGFSYKIDSKALTLRIGNLIKKYGLWDISIPGASVRAVRKW